MSPCVALASALLLSLSLAPLAIRAQVTATGTNGPTNPAQPTLGAYNQSSDSRLASLNSVDDFCLFAPQTPGSEIGNVEGEVVAWCTKPRNNARLIPDGTITAAHFVKTDLYVQIRGKGDLTALNIADGDYGGELDPHGATGDGNPVGGNVTSNVTGSDVFYEEWMSYVSAEDFCMRICISENDTYSAAVECQHTFDLMGCDWVMPGSSEDSFTSCDGDAAYPPGVYPVGDAGSGTTSTFAQRYTGTADGAAYTIGYTSTPQQAFSTPATSNCQTRSSISNGVTNLASSAAATNAASGSAASSGGSGSTAATQTAAAAAGSSGASSSSTSDGGSSAGNARWVLNREAEVLVAAASVFLAGGLGAGAIFL